jgi:hypothetical protein
MDKIILLLLKTKLNFFMKKSLALLALLLTISIYSQKKYILKTLNNWKRQLTTALMKILKNTTRTTYFIGDKQNWWIFKFQKRILMGSISWFKMVPKELFSILENGNSNHILWKQSRSKSENYKNGEFIDENVLIKELKLFSLFGKTTISWNKLSFIMEKQVPNSAKDE